MLPVFTVSRCVEHEGQTLLSGFLEREDAEVEASALASTLTIGMEDISYVVHRLKLNTGQLPEEVARFHKPPGGSPPAGRFSLAS